MKHIVYGIFWGTVALPFAKAIYHLVAWYTAGGMASGGLTAANVALLGFSAIYRSMAGAAVLLTLYAVPIFYLLRVLGRANTVLFVLGLILPWIVIDIYNNYNFNHFIEYAWYSIACGLVFAHYARRATS